MLGKENSCWLHSELQHVLGPSQNHLRIVRLLSIDRLSSLHRERSQGPNDVLIQSSDQRP